MRWPVTMNSVVSLERGSTMKYVYYQYTGEEQLFNITADPYELNDLSTTDTTTLEYWRDFLVQVFEDEGRTGIWVRDESLTTEKVCWMMDYTPNYPCWIDAVYTDGCSTT